MTPATKAKTSARERRRAAPDPASPAQVAPVDPAQLDEPAWRERAAFQVALDATVGAAGQSIWRTRIYHEEADSRAEWPGMASDEMLAWMCAQAGQPGQAIDAVAEDTTTPLWLDLGSLEVEEVPATRPRSGHTRPRQMRACLAFRLSGPQANLIATRRPRCVVQILACDIVSGAAAMLAAETLALRPELLDYTAAVGFDLPPIGSYQLLVIVLLPEHITAAVAIGLLLTVTP